eukprot:TRINITY_DN112697_c0_g1_i1.p1 TRINITY_DN112697_c0_g1~~TRINITY_DN112697_c0_g1_i1.p1  ORF type:complete len:464 (+),score=53.33 TRINITY_DN112697_c0_g1_i1:89-1393(+)
MALLQDLTRGNTVHTHIDFVDPAAVSQPEGSPPHPRLRENKHVRAAVEILDAAAKDGRETPRLEVNDCEFVTKAFGSRVASLLKEAACLRDVDLGITSDATTETEGTPLGAADGSVTTADPSTSDQALRKVANHLSSRIGLTEAWAKSLAKALSFKIVRLQTGWLFVVYCVPVGIMRRAVYPGGGNSRFTAGGAGLHADQDIGGDPLRHHGRVLRWFLERRLLRVLNVWMPLDVMGARPLCVMDTKTLQDEHQVRHRWLDHDGWFFLNDPKQVWWWQHDLGTHLGDAVFFDTLRSPHCAFALPDEELCKEVRDLILKCLPEVEGGNPSPAGLRRALEDIKAKDYVQRATHPCGRTALRGAISELEAACEDIPDTARARQNRLAALSRSLNRLQRQSVEARIVAIGPIPSPWTFIARCWKRLLSWFRSPSRSAAV